MSFISMSFSGALIILIVIIIRSLITHRLPKRTLLVFWGLALLRLLVPYNISSDVKELLPINRVVFSREEQEEPEGFYTETTGAAKLEEGIDIAKRTADAFVMRHISAPLPRVLLVEFSVRNMIWVLGMIVTAAFFAIAYLRWQREFKNSIPVYNSFVEEWHLGHKLRRHLEIKSSDRILAPVSYGVVKPIILVPKATDWDDEESLEYVFEHEYIHIQKFDAVIKFFLIAAVCVH